MSSFTNTGFSFFWLISLGKVPRGRISGSGGTNIFRVMLSILPRGFHSGPGPRDTALHPISSDWFFVATPMAWWAPQLGDGPPNSVACKCDKGSGERAGAERSIQGCPRIQWAHLRGDHEIGAGGYLIPRTRARAQGIYVTHLPRSF